MWTKILDDTGGGHSLTGIATHFIQANRINAGAYLRIAFEQDPSNRTDEYGEVFQFTSASTLSAVSGYERYCTLRDAAAHRPHPLRQLRHNPPLILTKDMRTESSANSSQKSPAISFDRAFAKQVYDSDLALDTLLCQSTSFNIEQTPAHRDAHILVVPEELLGFTLGSFWLTRDTEQLEEWGQRLKELSIWTQQSVQSDQYLCLHPGTLNGTDFESALNTFSVQRKPQNKEPVSLQNLSHVSVKTQYLKSFERAHIFVPLLRYLALEPKHALTKSQNHAISLVDEALCVYFLSPLATDNQLRGALLSLSIPIEELASTLPKATGALLIKAHSCSIPSHFTRNLSQPKSAQTLAYIESHTLNLKIATSGSPMGPPNTPVVPQSSLRL